MGVHFLEKEKRWLERRSRLEDKSREECGRGSVTDISWRALPMAASCWTCLIRAALGSEEALREEFRESIVMAMEKRNSGW